MFNTNIDVFFLPFYKMLAILFHTAWLKLSQSLTFVEFFKTKISHIKESNKKLYSLKFFFFFNFKVTSYFVNNKKQKQVLSLT